MKPFSESKSAKRLIFIWQRGYRKWGYCKWVSVCKLLVSSKRSSETMAYVRITRHSWEEGVMEGELTANELTWQFQWRFRKDKLMITPSLGRSLIKEPLARFLEKRDYELEPGGDYSFLIRGQV